MKTAAVILVLTLGLFPHCEDAAGQARWGFCSEYQTPPTSCTFEYDPICGRDGRTYGNKCIFCRAAFEDLGSLCFKRYGKC